MRRLTVFGLGLGLTLIGCWDPVRAASPIGIWCVERGTSRVEITPCDTALCGRIVWLHSPLDKHGREARDSKNPDVASRDRKLLGTTILRDLRESPERNGVWLGGTIYDPNNGKTYTCKLTLDGGDKLRLRGYVGVPLLGRTTVWTRAASERPGCP